MLISMGITESLLSNVRIVEEEKIESPDFKQMAIDFEKQLKEETWVQPKSDEPFYARFVERNKKGKLRRK